MALSISGLLFLAYFSDVLLGAMGGQSILSDVQEMLVLLAASIAFVIAILQREKQSKK